MHAAACISACVSWMYREYTQWHARMCRSTQVVCSGRHARHGYGIAADSRRVSTRPKRNHWQPLDRIAEETPGPAYELGHVASPAACTVPNLLPWQKGEHAQLVLVNGDGVNLRVSRTSSTRSRDVIGGLLLIAFRTRTFRPGRPDLFRSSRWVLCSGRAESNCSGSGANFAP